MFLMFPCVCSYPVCAQEGAAERSGFGAGAALVPACSKGTCWGCRCPALILLLLGTNVLRTTMLGLAPASSRVFSPRRVVTTVCKALKQPM